MRVSMSVGSKIDSASHSAEIMVCRKDPKSKENMFNFGDIKCWLIE